MSRALLAYLVALGALNAIAVVLVWWDGRRRRRPAPDAADDDVDRAELPDALEALIHEAERAEDGAASLPLPSGEARLARAMELWRTRGDGSSTRRRAEVRRSA